MEAKSLGSLFLKTEPLMPLLITPLPLFKIIIPELKVYHIEKIHLEYIRFFIQLSS